MNNRAFTLAESIAALAAAVLLLSAFYLYAGVILEMKRQIRRENATAEVMADAKGLLASDIQTDTLLTTLQQAHPDFTFTVTPVTQHLYELTFYDTTEPTPTPHKARFKRD